MFFFRDSERIITLSAANDITGQHDKNSYKILVSSSSTLIALDVLKTKNGYEILESFVKNYTKEDSRERILSVNPIYNHALESFFVLTNTRIVQVPIVSCSIYTSCTNCIRRGSRHCSWHKSACMKKEDIHNEDRESNCPPEIYNYSPHNGPHQGGTNITIYGMNFGVKSDSSYDKMEITFEKGNFRTFQRSCKVVSLNNSVVICTIDVNAPDSLQADDEQFTLRMKAQYESNLNKFGYFIKGEATSKETFQFKTPSIKGIFPNYGPNAGGTFVMVYGKNLDVGKNANVRFGERSCGVVSFFRRFPLIFFEFLTCFL